MSKSNVAEYHCEKCGHAKFYTQKKLLGMTLTKTLIHLLVFFGIILILFVAILGKFAFIELLTSGYLTNEAKVDSSELRHIAINATAQCDQDGYRANAFCYSYEIFEATKDTRYVPANLYDLLGSPTDTYQYGGDCKASSALFVSMVKSVGFYAQMKCSADEEHCISVVPYYDNGVHHPYFFVVDLTIPAYYRMEKGQDAWDYRELGARIDV